MNFNAAGVERSISIHITSIVDLFDCKLSNAEALTWLCTANDSPLSGV